MQNLPTLLCLNNAELSDREHRSSYLLSPAQAFLLKAGLLTGVPALTAWDQWKTQNKHCVNYDIGNFQADIF